MSNGWTTKVATIPAVNPAVDSIREDDRLLVLPSIGGTTLGIMVSASVARDVVLMLFYIINTIPDFT